MTPASFPPMGRLVDVGGHRLHCHISGKGSPAVIFEAGGAGWSLDWYPVQMAVAQFTQTCSYDRAGFGWSDPGPKPRTSGQILKELHALLAAAGVQKPYILVGASFGGHTVRLYAKNHPEDVFGLVLLDARHEALNSRMPPAWKQMETTGKWVYRFLLGASRLGILNLLGKMMGPGNGPPIVQQLPPEIRPTYLPVGFQAKYFQANLDELAACPESDAQLSAVASLGALPVTVVRHGIPDLFARLPAGQAGQAEKTWQDLQTDLARQSSNSRMLVAEKSGHGIQVAQPELVVEAIRDMVAMARDGTTFRGETGP